MTDRRKPICPYCPADMEHPDGVEMVARKGYGVWNALMFWYECSACNAASPRKHYLDEARTAAMTRYDEPLKPLKLHEVTGSEEPCVFLETRRYPPIKACDCVISADFRHVDVMMIGTQDPWVVPISEYGRIWRCWIRRPTDEERAATPWAQIDA